jgi:hypothetical protein
MTKRVKKRVEESTYSRAGVGPVQCRSFAYLMTSARTSGPRDEKCPRGIEME